MSTTDVSRPSAGDGAENTTKDSPEEQASVDAAGAGGRQWRTVWRVHFYSGMFALPFVLLMATTGLVILYTQPPTPAATFPRRCASTTSSTSPPTRG